MITLKFSFGNFFMQSRIVDGDFQFDGDTSKFNHKYRFEIRLSYNGKRGYFHYVKYHQERRKGKETLDKADYKDALFFVLMESYISRGSFKDFCSEFGYSDDNFKALKAYLTCKRNAERVYKVFSGLNLLSIQKELKEMM